MMKRMAPVYEAAHREESEGLDAAIAALTEIVTDSPDLYRGHLMLGRALASLLPEKVYRIMRTVYR